MVSDRLLPSTLTLHICDVLHVRILKSDADKVSSENLSEQAIERNRTRALHPIKHPTTLPTQLCVPYLSVWETLEHFPALYFQGVGRRHTFVGWLQVLLVG